MSDPKDGTATPTSLLPSLGAMNLSSWGDAMLAQDSAPPAAAPAAVAVPAASTAGAPAAAAAAAAGAGGAAAGAGGAGDPVAGPAADLAAVLNSESTTGDADDSGRAYTVQPLSFLFFVFFVFFSPVVLLLCVCVCCV